ncbi:MAG TPA: hypothetical protein VKA54_03095 [Gemmatimonadaceae bacterium]|nr:hypothetical protein [Gemmatimonadaceae bacterium]
MKRLSTTSASVALVALAAACAGDVPSAAVPTDAALAKGGPSAAAYTVLDVGAVLPGTSSEARGVNDVGVVVGFYFSGSSSYPFALVAGTPVTLGGGSGWALGISNGSPTYVVGYANSGKPVRWSLADPTQATVLPLEAGETSGIAKGVNDAGDVVGSVGPDAAMWLADGTRIPIATPAGFGRGEGRGINNGGLAIFQFAVAGAYSESADGRAYLRLASGATIELPPDGSDVTTYVNDISEVINGLVYVAGSTRSSALASRAVRWTVDAATGGIVATQILATIGGHGLGVSDAGGIAGFFDEQRIESFLWRGTNVLKLAPPKGTRDARAWAFSRSGRYVAGYAHSAGRALRWTITTP